MGIIRNKRNQEKQNANNDKIPRIEIELAGLSQELAAAQEAIESLNEAGNGALGGAIFESSQTITEDITLAEGQNGFSLGPIIIESVVMIEGDWIIY